ncbi:MAG: carbohydrate kinase [Actinobacteria bacterium]|nr:carbohydrate kinase [Actinomycetota bacterium]
MGEALVDRITTDDGNSTDVLGGGPFNAARVLGRLGAKTWFLGAVSTDASGERIWNALRECGVHAAVGERSSRPTGIAFARVQAGGSATYEFALDDSACADLTAGQALTALRAAGQVAVAHVGTLAFVLRPLREAAAAVLGAIEPTVLCFIDANCRPALVLDFAEYKSTLERAFARADVIKLSTEDATFLWPSMEPLAAARQLHHDCGAVVLLTDGERGVTALGRGFEEHLAAPVVEVADTVGAGDAFGAGFIARWLQAGHARGAVTDASAVVDACRVGMAVAAWTVQHVGAATPTWQDIPGDWMLD